MFRYAAGIIALLFTQGAFSAQYIQMDPTVVIPITLSSQFHNRIGISGDRVKKAFYKGSHVLVEVEEETGQLFVQSIRPNCPNTALSLVSTSGAVQDLELSFRETSSEIVILQQGPVSGRPHFEEAETVVVYDSLDQSGLIDLIEGVIQGQIPEGYVSIVEQDSPHKVKDGLTMQRISRLVGPDQIIFLYRLHNTGCKVKQVTECQVNILDGDWVFLDRNKLKSEENALVLIGCMR